MLRINLLPDYIHDKNKIRNLGFLWTIIIVAMAAVLLFFNGQAASNLEAAKKDHADKEALKLVTEAHKKDIEKEKGDRAIIESKQTFVLHAKTYNDGWADVFETIRDVQPTDSSIILNTMDLDKAAHSTVSLTGFGVSELAIVRWWMSLRNNTALFSHVNFDLVPHAYAPVSETASGGMGPMGGMLSPNSGGPMGGVGSGGPTSRGMGKMGLGPGGVPGGMSGGRPGGFGGGQASASNGPGELQGKQGINFTASVVLKSALAGGIPTPIWPAGGAAPAGGFGGGFGPGSAGVPGMGAPGTGGMGSGGPGANSGGGGAKGGMM